MKAGVIWVKDSLKRKQFSLNTLSMAQPVIPAGMTKLVLSWLVHFMLYYPVIMRHICGMCLAHEEKKKRKSETTLPWSTAYDSGTKPRIRYSAEEEGKTYHQSSVIWLKVFLISNSWGKHGAFTSLDLWPFWLTIIQTEDSFQRLPFSQLCVLCAHVTQAGRRGQRHQG